ncbi:MAG: Rpn family recombination-promoting nuclease/putative transposase [Emergencia sp.]|nr:Rpn family recombination-promoting nuclease/putative transposase [Emergencia sp.]
MKKKSLFENARRGAFNFYDDWVFHYIFSKDAKENKKALIAIINVILDRKADPIEEIQIMNPYIYGEKPYMKGAVLDIKAQTTMGELLDIEMQNGNLDFYTNRSVFYCGKLINLSLEKGEDYDKMKKSIVISIVKGNIFPQTKKLHSTFYFMENEEHFRLSEAAEIHFVELEKVDTRKPIDEMEPLESLAAYMLFAGDQTQEMYVQDLIDRGGEAVIMAERLFKELTEDQIAFEMREQQIKTEHSIATLKYVEEKRKAELDEWEASIIEKETNLAEKETNLAEKETNLADKETSLADKETNLADKETSLADKETSLAEKEIIVDEREKGLEIRLNELQTQQEQLALQQEQLYKKQREFALSLKRAGIDDEQIADLTGLNLQEIAGL